MNQSVTHYDLLEQLYDGVYYVDQDHRISYWNAAAERITGYKKEEVLGKLCSDNILRHIDASGCEVCISGCPLHQTIADGKLREQSLILHHKEGHRVPVHIRIAPIKDEEGNILGGVEVFSDNSQTRELIEALEEATQEKLRDPLLEIGNRRYAEIVYESRLYEFKAHQVPFSLVIIDIDDFKAINDQYGHNVGDKVLKMVARSLEQSLRNLDHIIRWGGDEFVLLLPNVSESGLPQMLERLRVLVENSFLIIDEKKVSVTASMGAIIASQEDSLEEAIDRADQLLFGGKNTGKNRILIQEKNQ